VPRIPEAIQTLLTELQVRPDGRRSFADLASAVSPEMLDDIARGDYGVDFSDHRSALQDIVESREPPDRRQHQWYPFEVLELGRWSEPDREGSPPAFRGRRGHVMRAFCCTTLLTAAGIPGVWGYFGGEPSTLLQLIASAIEIGEPHLSSVASLIVWRLGETEVEETESLFFILGLLIVFRCSVVHHLAPAHWSALAAWLDDAELKARVESSRSAGGD
jgi:hypothetical protein